MTKVITDNYYKVIHNMVIHAVFSLFLTAFDSGSVSKEKKPTF